MAAVLLCMLFLEGDKVLAKQTSTFCFLFGRAGGAGAVVSFFPQRSCNRAPGAHKDGKRVTQALDGRGSQLQNWEIFQDHLFLEVCALGEVHATGARHFFFPHSN